jgi:hypothetical protein
MAEQIVLGGQLDLAETYGFIQSWEEAHRITEIQNGGFTFEIRGLKEVKVQVYGTGKVIINSDDYADPAELIRIVELALWGPDDRPVKLRIEKVQPMPSTAHNIAAASLAKEVGIESSDLFRDTDRLVKWEAARLKRIYAQEAHPNAGELAPGGEEYRTTLEELGVLRRIEPLIEEQGVV